VAVTDIIDQGAVAGCAITDRGITERRIGPLGSASQVMNRRFSRNLDMTDNAICFNGDGDDTADHRLLVAVETAVCAVGYAVIVAVRIGNNRTAGYGLAVQQMMEVAVGGASGIVTDSTVILGKMSPPSGTKAIPSLAIL